MLKKKNSYVVAVVGASDVVGRELIEFLEEKSFPVSKLVLLASETSAGERIEFIGRNCKVMNVTKDSFTDVDIAFFSVGASLSLEFIPKAAAAGAVVIDTSNAFRTDPNVPLVVPGVNDHLIANDTRIIASPNCATVGLAVALKPIHTAATIKRIVVTTFQSVSGSGKDAIEELAGQTVALLNFKDVEKNVYPHQIAFNCIPHVDAFLDSGDTAEEIGISNEIRTVLENDSIRVTVTAVRVPVFRGHSASVNIETEKILSPNEVSALLSAAPDVVVYDAPKSNIYPLAIDAVGKDETYVGRIRTDESIPHGINLWLAFDNIRRGAALNMVQIAEHVIRFRAL